MIGGEVEDLGGVDGRKRGKDGEVGIGGRLVGEVMGKGEGK